ncbi:hypothetical protein ACHAXS_012733 [Conticribra weissflogii]
MTMKPYESLESTEIDCEPLPNKVKTATNLGLVNPKLKPTLEPSTAISPIELFSCSATNDRAIKRERSTRYRQPPFKCNEKVVLGETKSESTNEVETATINTIRTKGKSLPTKNARGRSDYPEDCSREGSRTITIVTGNKLFKSDLVRGGEASSKTNGANVVKVGNKNLEGKRPQVLLTDGRKAPFDSSVDEKPPPTLRNLRKCHPTIKSAKVDRLADRDCMSTSSKSTMKNFNRFSFTLASYPTSMDAYEKDRNSHHCQQKSRNNRAQYKNAQKSKEKLSLIGSLASEEKVKQRRGVALKTNDDECMEKTQEACSFQFPSKQDTQGEKIVCNRLLERSTKTAEFEGNCTASKQTDTDKSSFENSIQSKNISGHCNQSFGNQETNCLVAACFEGSVQLEESGDKSGNNKTNDRKIDNIPSRPKLTHIEHGKNFKTGIDREGRKSSRNCCDNFRDRMGLPNEDEADRQNDLSSAAKQLPKEIEDDVTKYRCSSDSSDILLSDLQNSISTAAISTGKNNNIDDSGRYASFPLKDHGKGEDVVSDTPPHIDDSSRTEMFPASFLCRTAGEKNERKTPLSYPYAPMGQLWLDSALSSKKHIKTDEGKNVDLKYGGTLIGRRWVWDEGYYGDGHLDMGLGRIFQLMNRSSSDTSVTRPFPKGCSCGADHSSLKESDKKRWNLKYDVASARGTRRSERSSSSTRMSNVVSQLADGRLNPHTLINCEDYSWGPEFRFLKNIQTESVQPFSVRVSPDVTFLADLHAHLCDAEIIGFLGGYYSMEEKCIYIQAAFPCKSTSRLDSGHTDVEMDPISQIHAREAIANHGMSVVGWYHSHPTFQPDPSVTDIENQASYQQLFTSDSDSHKSSNTDSNSVIDCYSSSDDEPDSIHAGETSPHYRRAGFISPFVGLIVGTYDSKNPSSQSVMRWFHVTSKYTEHGKFVNFPMNLKTTNRHFRRFADEPKGEKLENVRSDMSKRSVWIRNELESTYLSCPLTDFSQLVSPENDLTSFRKQTLKDSQLSVLSTDLEPQLAEGHTSSEGLKNTYFESIESGDDNQISRNTIIDLGPDDGHTIATRGQSKKVVSIKGKTNSIESFGTLILKEELFEKDHQPERSASKTAQPLFFTEKERSILGLKPGDVSFDVIGGVIWLAVEREQHTLIQSSSGQDSLSMTMSDPSSSRSILELLLRHSFSGDDSFDRKIYEMIQCIGESGSAIIGEETSLKESDAAITHSVDVVLSHYASKGTRFDPFNTWNGAGDKGLIINKDSACTPSESDSWKDFYFTKVLGMSARRLPNGVVEYVGGSKMKRGHKLAACLLKWASFMQISPGLESSSKQSGQFSYDVTRHEYGLEFDHERELIESSIDVSNHGKCHTTGELDYIYFVAEVMRLLAARWREGKGTPVKRNRPTTSLPPKRARPASGKHAAEGQKRGRGRPRKVQASNASDEVNVVKRGRGRPRKTENRGPGRPKTSETSGN